MKLESERNIGDVYDSLCSWIKKVGMYPLELHIDTREVDLAQTEQWRSCSVDTVQQLDLRAGTINNLHQKQLMTIIDYFLLLDELIKKFQAGEQGKQSEQLEREISDAWSEYDHVRQVIPRMLNLSEDEFSKDFKQLDVAAQEISLTNSKPPELIRFRTILNKLKIILLDRLTEITQPAREMQKTAEMLKNMLPSLEDIGTALQTGSERDAYGFVLKISEVIAKSIRIMDVLTIEYPDQSFKELNETKKNLSELIAEMNNTIGNKDSVLLADILEYDLRELLNIFTEQLFSLSMGEE